MTSVVPVPLAGLLPEQEAATYAGWFACLAEPMRVKLLHAVATSPRGLTVGALTEILGSSQSTCSHHVRKLAEVGFLHLRKEGTATVVTINQACCSGLPHAADAVMGLLAPRPCCPDNVPDDVIVRPMADGDEETLRRVSGEGAAAEFDVQGFPDHRWVAECEGEIVGWAVAAPISSRACHQGVAETFVRVAESHRGRGVGKALIHKQVTQADAAGIRTLQTSVFTDDRASLALYRSAGYRTVGIRERIARRGDVWHDTIFLERRAEVDC